MIGRKCFASYFLIILYGLSMTSCGELTKLDSKGSKTDLSSKYYYTGDGLVYTVNPVIATNSNTISTANFNNKLVRDFVTDQPYLQRKNYFERAYSDSSTRESSGLANLFLVENDAEVATVPLQATNGSWRYDLHSDEFYQVNTFYHLNKLSERLYKTLAFGHSYLYLDSNMQIPPAIKYNYTETNSLWLTEEGAVKTLNAYSKCYLDPINAYFSSAENVLCMGYNTNINDNFRITQDPSVIYHEMGHALVQAMINQRNIKFNNPFLSYHDFQTSLGVLQYDEAGAINEGLCDYISYFINGRDGIGEWAIGRFYNAARPISESNELHQVAGISESADERLSYPQYVRYDANFPTQTDEDIHLSGQIVSHYLVALTRALKTQCSDPTLLSDVTNGYLSDLQAIVKNDFKNIYGRLSAEATSVNSNAHAYSSAIVMMIINETLAEVGDLYGEGSDVIADGQYFTNHNTDESFLWTQQVDPINFRRFFKIFAKNIKHHISQGLCPEFTLDESEKLLDDYGLLLFTYYGDLGKTGDGQTTYASSINGYVNDLIQGQSLNALSNFDSNLQVNSLNRRNTTLVSKDFLEIPTGTIAFVDDKQVNMKKALAQLTFQGRSVTTSADVADVKFNNSNGRISPGEIIGLAVNIKNTSNSTIAGLQLLGNDWDHMKIDDESAPYVDNSLNLVGQSSSIANFKPCIFDDFPLATEDGVTDSDDTDPGNCSYISRDNSVFDSPTVVASNNYTRYALDAPQPICLVQISDENETKWVSQDYYRKVVMGLEDSKCLNNESISDLEFNPNECLVRLLPGANQAYFSLLEPQKTWGETNEGNISGSTADNQYMIMEVNKWIEPGTKFNCRFRARFTNCIDCYSPDTNSEDYADYQYSGAEPFKILNLSFDVID